MTNSVPKISYSPAMADQVAQSDIGLIKSYGFTRAGSCSCGGTQNELYKKDTYILYYRKTRHVFKIKQKNDVIVPVTSLSKLEETLTKLFPDAVAVAEEKV